MFYEKKGAGRILPVPSSHKNRNDHPVWKDVLTSYNGEPVTYDAMGNITSLGDYSYTWTGGRQLKSVTSEDRHFEYFYNADGS